MQIKSEHYAVGWDEYDFVFHSEVDMEAAAQALTEAGYAVGGGSDSFRATIAVCGGKGPYIDKARDIIQSISIEEKQHAC